MLSTLRKTNGQRGEREGGLYRWAGQVLASLTSFMNSSDMEI